MKRNQINSHDKGIQSKTFSHFLMQEESRDGDKHCGRHEVCHHYLYTQEILHFPVCQSWYSIRFSGKKKKKKKKRKMIGWIWHPLYAFQPIFFSFSSSNNQIGGRKISNIQMTAYWKKQEKKKNQLCYQYKCTFLWKSHQDPLSAQCILKFNIQPTNWSPRFWYVRCMLIDNSWSLYFMHNEKGIYYLVPVL